MPAASERARSVCVCACVPVCVCVCVCIWTWWVSCVSVWINQGKSECTAAASASSGSEDVKHVSMTCARLFCIHLLWSQFGVLIVHQTNQLCLKKQDVTHAWCKRWTISNPKVLFTFQFGSRIVPVLREQDLRKSLVSIIFQPASHFLSLLAQLSVLPSAVRLQPDAKRRSFLSFGFRGCGRFCRSNRPWVVKEWLHFKFFH